MGAIDKPIAMIQAGFVSAFEWPVNSGTRKIALMVPTMAPAMPSSG